MGVLFLMNFLISSCCLAVIFPPPIPHPTLLWLGVGYPGVSAVEASGSGTSLYISSTASSESPQVHIFLGPHMPGCSSRSHYPSISPIGISLSSGIFAILFQSTPHSSGTSKLSFRTWKAFLFWYVLIHCLTSPTGPASRMAY